MRIGYCRFSNQWDTRQKEGAGNWAMSQSGFIQHVAAPQNTLMSETDQTAWRNEIPISHSFPYESGKGGKVSGLNGTAVVFIGVMAVFLRSVRRGLDLAVS